jgi:hypothetical protein
VPQVHPISPLLRIIDREVAGSLLIVEYVRLDFLLAREIRAELACQASQRPPLIASGETLMPSSRPPPGGESGSRRSMRYLGRGS